MVSDSESRVEGICCEHACAERLAYQGVFYLGCVVVSPICMLLRRTGDTRQHSFSDLLPSLWFLTTFLIFRCLSSIARGQLLRGLVKSPIKLSLFILLVLREI